jgi:hypothetical protein
MTKTNNALVLSVGSLLALGLFSPAAAATTSTETTTTTTATAKPADSAGDHLALAEDYRKKTAAYREDATMHRQMLETYKKRVSIPADARSPVENSYVKKMRLHCEAYVRDADKLAADSEKFAEFHTMRAAELQGK